MKHLTETTTLQAIRDKLLTDIPEGDPIVCILRPYQTDFLGKENAGNPKLLLKSHFEAYFMNLLNYSLRGEERNSSLQKFIRPCNDMKYILRAVKSKNEFEIEVRGESYSGSYHINGKYSSDAHLKGNTDSTVSTYDKQSLEEIARVVLEFLKKNNENVENVDMEWVKDSTGVFTLVYIQVGKKLSIKNTSRSISPKLSEQSLERDAAKIRIHRIKPNRPPSLPRATSARKAKDAKQPQPPPTQKLSQSFRTKLARSDSSTRAEILTPTSEIFPTPRSFTNTSRTINSGLDSSRSNAPILNLDISISDKKPKLKLLEYKEYKEFQEKFQQDSIEERNEMSSSEVAHLRKRNEELESKLHDIKLLQKKQLEELDLSWRAKCLKLYNSLNAKHAEEMQTLRFQILELTEQLNSKK